MSTQQPQRAPQPRPRRRGSNRTLVIVFIGIGAGAILLGTWQTFLQPAIHSATVHALASEGVIAMENWQPIGYVELQGEPELVELEDGTIRLTGTYTGPKVLDESNVALRCDSLDMPFGWSLVECRISPDDEKTLSIIIERR